MALTATGFTRLLGTGIPRGETLLSVTVVSDHVVWFSHRLQLPVPPPSLSPPPPPHISGKQRKHAFVNSI